ncbi:DNA mismatch repair endonuclease MutL [Halanaerobium salsuginis]|uniref:DNA mismatch repair protein MutL n=1 Tax=Halanaerobium salsuginis TaxID=29563 RepID=A0A1I4F323_9FIRM|nr:DNA mismatch repair endonuclease MutL [Halanaerobium salsuginis]SFL12358.1 DNA mismatch repair protein MutL [Halanaerobium salsuginis]
MGIIKQLPQNVANQISAGEVIERPASIVKELLENSIDAGATKVEIKIENGGRDLIRIKDNGQGIMADDMESAFNRYATSKIEDIDDLYSLYSLGFRGEALASIASVSEVEMISRHQSAEAATKIKLKGGEILAKNPTGATVGTDVRVKDLFYNTPARYKYLKTTTTEFTHISRIVSAEAVANSKLALQLFHDQRQIISTPGNGSLKDTIYAVFGSEIAANLFPIEIEDRYIKLSGYLCRPELTRSSRSHELLFANGRPIYNNLVARAVESAYSHLIDPGRRPIVFLFIKVNPILVDVNVHPAKREVKFSRGQIIYDVIKKAVRNVLKANDPTTRIKLNKQSPTDTNEIASKTANNEVKNENNENSTSRQKSLQQSKIDLKQGSNSLFKNSAANAKHLAANNDSNFTEYSTSDAGQKRAINKSYSSFSKKNNYKGNQSMAKNNLKESEQTDTSLISENENEEYSLADTAAHEEYFKYLAQIFNSYILIETDLGLKIVDQHNAHERILFEKFFQEYNQKNKSVQSLLLPVKLELSPSEMEIVKQYQAEINQVGIEFSDFGSNTILIQEVPVLLKNRSTRNILEEMIAELARAGRALSPAEVQESMLKYLACRTAIKAGKPLTPQESIELVKGLYQTENPYRCPHSRPIMINISRDEIEKGLGRK